MGAAALIATVMFAAAFTLPDAIAMVFSIFAVCSYFNMALEVLPRQKYFTLFATAPWFVVIAMAAMVIAFVTDTYAVFTPTSGLAIATCFIGLTVFLLLHGVRWGLQKVASVTSQNSSKMREWNKEEDRWAVGEKVGLTGHSREETCEAQDAVGVEFKKCQNRKWKADRGEWGECSKHAGQRKVREEKGVGLASSEPVLGLQNVNFSRSQSLDGLLKEYLDKVEKGMGLVATEDLHGFQKVIISRSQSLEGPLKDYLENLEWAFIRAKFRSSLPFKGKVSVVKETNDTSESNSSEDVPDDDHNRDKDSFKSILATRGAGEVGVRTQNRGTTLQRKKTNTSGNIGGDEEWNVDDEREL
ncbi:hypothetical protein QYF36_016036 [Acer negundo]|nr:hypothetical protein QYF36_016036 [Acer negundo]